MKRLTNANFVCLRPYNFVIGLEASTIKVFENVNGPEIKIEISAQRSCSMNMLNVV